MGESRLAELLGGLALASDLANAFPPEKVLRTAILAVLLARHAGEDAEAQRDAYYVTLLRFLGCTGFAHEEAHVYGAGDDAVTRNVMALADEANPGDTLRAIVTRIGSEGSLGARARAVGALLTDREAVTKHAHAQCDTSLRCADLVGVSARVRTAIAQVCERFDGRGAPARVPGEGVALAARLLHVADVAEIVHHREGAGAAGAELRRRAGKQLDPRLTAAFVANAGAMWEAIAGPSVWERFLSIEPTPWVMKPSAAPVATAFAHLADLKSVFTLGHSLGVAALATAAARDVGESAATLEDLEQAALLHDVGRVSVPTGIWDKPGGLGDAEWERVRLHAYYTERIALRAPAWARAAKIASMAHERLDGNGYHRGVPASLLGRPERILAAAADVLHALREPRPHRPARSLTEARDVLAAEVRAGRLDAMAVDAVLAAAGVARGRVTRRAWPRGLSDREVEVLRLVARGKSNKEIGVLLGISARTVQNHVASAYDRVGIYSRAGAALFVTEQGLLDLD